MQKKKKHPLNHPPNISPLGACTWKIALKYEVKQRKKGKFTSNYKASPIDFETQIPPPPPVVKPLRIYAPPKLSPSKRAFEKYKPRTYFWNFTVYQ